MMPLFKLFLDDLLFTIDYYKVINMFSIVKLYECFLKALNEKIYIL